MIIRSLNQLPVITAGDQSQLREYFNPSKEPIFEKVSYSLAHAKVAKSSATIPHKLSSSEVYFILEGNGIMHINGESREVTKYDVVYIRPHSIQYIENTGEKDLEFLCIVEPAWKPECEIILPDIKQS